MIEVICLPPLTGAYLKNVGPALTLAYAKTLSISRKSPIIIPWNCGGRKVDKQQLVPTDILSSVEGAKVQYRSLGLWPEDCMEHSEFEPAFREAVITSSKQGFVSEQQVDQHFCTTCNKSRISGRAEDRCPVCKSVCTKKTTTAEFGVWTDADIHRVLRGLNDRQQKRMAQPQFSGYRMQVYREKLADDHWKFSDKTYNQRFVAAQWLRFIHERYAPDRVVVVCGQTVEKKWLLPSLLLLNESQQQKTHTYIHGIVHTDLTLESVFDLRDGLGSGALRYAIAPANIGTDFSLKAASFDDARKLRRKAINCAEYLRTVVPRGHAAIIDERITSLPELVNAELQEGNHANAYGIIRDYTYALSRGIIPRIRANGTSDHELTVLNQVLTYVTTNLS